MNGIPHSKLPLMEQREISIIKAYNSWKPGYWEHFTYNQVSFLDTMRTLDHKVTEHYGHLGLDVMNSITRSFLDTTRTCFLLVALLETTRIVNRYNSKVSLEASSCDRPLTPLTYLYQYFANHNPLAKWYWCMITKNEAS